MSLCKKNHITHEYLPLLFGTLGSATEILLQKQKYSDYHVLIFALKNRKFGFFLGGAWRI